MSSKKVEASSAKTFKFLISPCELISLSQIVLAFLFLVVASVWGIYAVFIKEDENSVNVPELPPYITPPTIDIEGLDDIKPLDIYW
ncbi:MAG: hypothetical protein EZS28_047780, partial [Streblomastix strix]